MTEYWVSQAKFWCELCKCWLTDTPTAKANHEKGTGHKLAVQRKLRELRKNAEVEKKEKERTDTELAKIEKAAERAYQKDLEKQEADAAPLPPPAQPPPQLGSWQKNSQSKYLYNSELKWYYDEGSGFYYGGEPPEWTASPAIPEAAKYKGTKQAVTVVKGKLPDHIANLGGYKAPIKGELTRGVFGSKTTESAPSKRTREDMAGTAKTATEAEELRKREEARERVKKRTASSFGLQ